MNDNNRAVLLVIIVLALVLCCCLALVAGGVLVGSTGLRMAQDFGGFGTVPATTTYSESFNVDSPARLIVDGRVGNVEIVAGEGSTIRIDAQLTAYGSNPARAEELLRELRVRTSQTGSEVHFEAGWSDPAGGWRGQSPKVDVRIVVPVRTGIELTHDVGDVSISGTQGDVDVQTDVGRVTLRDVRPLESLQVETDVAEIQFEGALTQGAGYELTSDVGAINLRLPANSRFAIDASSDVGGVSVDFDVVGKESSGFIGKSVQGVVGGDDSTTLYLRSDVGAIVVRAQ